MKNIMKIVGLLFIGSISSTTYATSNTNMLCKVDGKKVVITPLTARNECFDAIYWGSICYIGNYQKAAKILQNLLPIQTKSHKISYIDSLSSKIYYLSDDLNSGEAEEVTIKNCSSVFLR